MFPMAFRVWAGPVLKDVAIATKPIAPDLWTHLAVPRDAKGGIRIYIDRELDALGTKKVAANLSWKVTNDDVGDRFADPCGGQRLANGNTIICSYGQKNPNKPMLFEITPDKKVVWEFFHPKVRAHEVHVLKTNGKPEGALK